jgi:DNA-binding GntR family transcriptional regulator
MVMADPSLHPKMATVSRSTAAEPTHPARDEDAALALLRSTSLTTLIQEKIERMILEGELKAGQRLNELALAQALGVSRSPVREACRKLEQAGMVEIINNRGMFVRRVDLQQALDIYEIRGALAELSGRLLARHATDSDIEALRAQVAQMEATAASGDATEYYRQNLAFHRRLVENTRNARLADMFLGTDKELHLYRQRSLVQPSGMEVSNQEHRAIVEAVAAHDETLAGQVFKRHVLNGRDRAISAAGDAEPRD